MRRPPNFRAGACSESETVGNAHHGGAQSLTRAPIFGKGWCTELETVGNFHHEGAQSLKRPALLVNGEHRKCPEPETVGDFMMGVQTA